MLHLRRTRRALRLTLPRWRERLPLVLGSLLCLAYLAWAEEGPPSRQTLVHADGAVTTSAAHLSAHSPDGGAQPVMRFEFGLPTLPAVRRWLEEEVLPIYHTLWEKDGVRYTQTVLRGRLLAEPSTGPAKVLDEGLLMVRLAGENTTTDYTNAAAALVVRLGRQVLPLELCDGVVYWRRAEKPVPLAVVDISASATMTTNGTRLDFSGNMPPGTTGSMTIKIPSVRLDREDDLRLLRDLDFEEEFQRVKKAARQAGKQAAGPSPPVAWAESGK